MTLEYDKEVRIRSAVLPHGAPFPDEYDFDELRKALPEWPEAALNTIHELVEVLEGRSIRELLAKVAKLENERNTWVEAIADFFRAQQDCLPTLEGEDTEGGYIAEWPKLEGDWDELPELHVNHVGPALGARAGGKVWWRFVTGGQDAADAYKWPAEPRLRTFRWTPCVPLEDGERFEGAFKLAADDGRQIAQGVKKVIVLPQPAVIEPDTGVRIVNESGEPWWKWLVVGVGSSTAGHCNHQGAEQAAADALGFLQIPHDKVTWP